MSLVALVAGAILLTVVLLDAFQTIILPRRPVGRFRITRAFYRSTWQPWRGMADRLRSRTGREHFLSIYGPLSLLILFFVWAFLLTIGFGLVFWGLCVPFRDPLLTDSSAWARLRSCLYVSGTTLFTLGLGDVLPQSHAARLLTVMEAGTGLGFIALVIGYVPVLYSSFSQREILVALLDARAGSPPTAVELLLRHDFPEGPEAMRALLVQWEGWSAELLETHISYPLLCYYRSQHDNQSWLSALTAVLDCCALMISSLDGSETRQAQLTFVIGRHVLVDLVHVFQLESKERRMREAPPPRLPAEDLARLCTALAQTAFSPCIRLRTESYQERLTALRRLYEPAACTLAEYLRLGLPHWIGPASTVKRTTDIWSVMNGISGSKVREQSLEKGTLADDIRGLSTTVHLESHDVE